MNDPSQPKAGPSAPQPRVFESNVVENGQEYKATTFWQPKEKDKGKEREHKHDKPKATPPLVPPPPPPVQPVQPAQPQPIQPQPQPPIIITQPLPQQNWNRIRRAHPLLWLSLFLSLCAIILGVPKGALPTITGRHRALRAQELLVQDRLALLSQLSTFLPPPLASLLEHPQNLDVVRLGAHQSLQSEPPWWSTDELRSGAAVVRSLSKATVQPGKEKEREVWILRAGEGDAGARAMLVALTSSLAARERLYDELDRVRTRCVPSLSPAPACETKCDKCDERDKCGNEACPKGKDRRERADRERERDRDRADALEEREREVVRREKWVVDAMRKLSDKSQAVAEELSLEDRITQRLKSYARQLGRRDDK